MKKRLIVLFAVMAFTLSLLFSACSDNNNVVSKRDNSSPDEVHETTLVLETTAEGGTVEQDSEGNKVTRDKDGNITSVKDKNGNAINVEEYISTHRWIVEPQSGSAGNSGSSSSKKGSSGSGNSSSGSDSEDEGNGVEKDIPEVVANQPSKEDLDKSEPFPDI